MEDQDAANLSLNLQRGRRGPTSSSCAECKRLKIRCSGTAKPFPCTSCERRGVAAICPNGVMPERQRRKESTDADILRRRNQVLTARVKELEEALAKTKAGSSAGVSPAAASTSSEDRRTDDEETVYHKEMDDRVLVEAFGTLTIEDTGRTTWHGPFSPSINLLPADDPIGPLQPDSVLDETLPPELMLLAAGFPFTAPTAVPGMKDAIRTLSPTYADAAHFANAFFNNAAWLGSPCTQDRFFTSILMPLYASKNWESQRADVIAFFFGVLAVGSMFDYTRPHYDPISFKLNKLCAASLAIAKVTDNPTLTGLEALQTHLFFHQLTDSPQALARFWTLSAVAFRMVYSLGLHRNSKAWGLDPSVEQRRRWLFWQLNFMDAVITASYGRPRFFNSHHYDCPLPDPSSRPDLKGAAIWRFEFLRDGLLPVLEEGFAVDPPTTYTKIMQLDNKIRSLPNFDAEKLGIDLITMSAGEAMQLFCVSGLKELALLYLHRRFLFEAACDESCDDIAKHRFSYSVTATFRSSLAMVRQTRGLFYKDKNLICRLFFIWLHGFSAFIVLATLVIKRPTCSFAEQALSEMQSLLIIFQQSQSSRRVQRCLPSMITLRDKALAILALSRTGENFKAPPDAQLDRLLGGVPVVLKRSMPSRCELAQNTSPSQPVPQDNMTLDLESLFGQEQGPINVPPNAPQDYTLPNSTGSLHWNAINGLPPLDEMGQLDNMLNPFFNDRSNLNTAEWDELMKSFA